MRRCSGHRSLPRRRWRRWGRRSRRWGRGRGRVRRGERVSGRRGAQRFAFRGCRFTRPERLLRARTDDQDRHHDRHNLPHAGFLPSFVGGQYTEQQWCHTASEQPPARPRSPLVQSDQPGCTDRSRPTTASAGSNAMPDVVGDGRGEGAAPIASVRSFRTGDSMGSRPGPKLLNPSLRARNAVPHERDSNPNLAILKKPSGTRPWPVSSLKYRRTPLRFGDR
jgi:hypothetical protein